LQDLQAIPEIRAIADYNDLCGENPLWLAQERCLFWTDITGKRFYRFDWDKQESRVLHEGFEIAGCALHRDGGFVVTNSDGIWYWHAPDEPRLIASEVDGSRCQMNDCIADPAGRVFSGSWFYDSMRDDYPLGKLMRLSLDGKVDIVDEGIQLSNGLGFSGDCRTLYFVDSAARRIYAYDYSVKTGDVKNRRVFVDVPREEGVPDGLTVDSEGFVWCAHWFGGCVIRYDPDGVAAYRLNVPASQTSSVAFGGPDLTDLFITSASFSDSLPLAPPGYDPALGYVGGRLFSGNCGVRGREEFRAAISIKKTKGAV
jgi:D-xylonolactonase